MVHLKQVQIYQRCNEQTGLGSLERRFGLVYTQHQGKIRITTLVINFTLVSIVVMLLDHAVDQRHLQFSLNLTL